MEESMIKREKRMFSMEKHITKDDFIGCSKHFPVIFLKPFLQHCLLVLVFFLIIGVFYYWSLYETILSVVVVCILGFVIDFFRYKSIVLEYYDYYRKIGTFDLEATIIFYSSYLVQKGSYIHIYVEYDKIYRIVEDHDYFYLDNPISTVIVPKKDCSDEIVSFIKGMKVKKYIDKSKDSKLISLQTKKKILLGFTIFSIVSIFLAFFTQVQVSGHLPGQLHLTTLWVFFTWLPIPIICLVLSILYSKLFPTEKNLITSLFCIIILVAIGSLSFLFPTDKTNYSTIQSYQNILDISIPKDGIYYQNDIYTNYLNSSLILYGNFAYYPDDMVDVSLEKEIHDSSHWIKGSQLGDLKEVVPYYLRSNMKDNYYLIYNQDIDTYNTSPTVLGTTHHMLVAVYNDLYSQLEIYQFGLVLQ